MAKSDTSTADEVAAAANQDTNHVTLDEFCLRFSAVDSRVELLHGFAFTERQAGRFKDAESNYQARLTAYANKPI